MDSFAKIECCFEPAFPMKLAEKTAEKQENEVSN
jgi:hypothetical protein